MNKFYKVRVGGPWGLQYYEKPPVDKSIQPVEAHQIHIAITRALKHFDLPPLEVGEHYSLEISRV